MFHSTVHDVPDTLHNHVNLSLLHITLSSKSIAASKEAGNGEALTDDLPVNLQHRELTHGAL